jgi:uncharacterized membrane protein YjdF
MPRGRAGFFARCEPPSSVQHLPLASVMKNQAAIWKHSPPWLSYLELPVLTLLFIVVAINLPYESYGVITVASLILLAMLRVYIKWRYGITTPFVILLLVFLSVQIDAVGNFLSLYKTMKEPLPYDVCAHFMIPLLSAPVIIWLFATGIEQFNYRLPLGVISFFSVTINFFLSGFYEVVELWDELFFHGQRIWTLHDTSNDLQWGLLGGIAGALLTYFFLKFHSAHDLLSAQRNSR